MLRRILLTALAAGLLSGLAAFVLQQARVVPLIRQAEIYETRAALIQTAVAHAQHHPDGVAEKTAPAEEGWEPAPGLERLGYTLMTDTNGG
jgi:predicted cobalt transporter CbtA